MSSCHDGRRVDSVPARFGPRERLYDRWFAVAAGLAGLAALASLLRGGRYVHPVAADEVSLPTTEPLPMGGALPVSTALPAEGRGRGEANAAARPRTRSP